MECTRNRPQIRALGFERLESRMLLTGSKLIEQFPLIVPESEFGDVERFGYSVAIDGDWAVVGAPNAVYNNSRPGAAYVFERLGGKWRQQSVLTIEDRERSGFGSAVAISGTTIVVGAPGTGDDEFVGAAYIFAKVGPSWVVATELSADVSLSDDGFGAAVTIEDSTILVSSIPKLDFDLPNADRVYVYEQQEEYWSETAILSAPSNKYGSFGFGTTVAVSGNRIAIGAPTARGEGTYDPVTGAVFLYERRGGEWQYLQEINSPFVENTHQFGYSIGITGDTLVVGAPFESLDPNRKYAGAVYDFEYINGEFLFRDRIVASNAVAGASFGISLSMQNDVLVVGSYYDGYDVSDVASVYLFVRDDNGNWQEHDDTTSSLGKSDDGFGLAVASSGDTVFVGAFRNDASGVNDGAVHAFEISTAEGDLSLYEAKQPAIDRVDIEYGIQGIEGLVRFDVYRSTDAEFDEGDLDHLVVESTVIARDGVAVYQFDPGEFESARRYLIVRATSTNVELTLANNQLAVAQIPSLNSEFIEQSALFVDEGTWWQNSTYGYAIATNGRWAVIGDRGLNEASRWTGAVHVYEVVDGYWIYRETLFASDREDGDGFGHSVAIDGDTLLVGAPWDDDVRHDAGAVYVFKLKEEHWIEETKLRAEWSEDGFGDAVGVDGGTFVIGAARQNVFMTTQQSAAYIYEVVDGTYARVYSIRELPGVNYNYRNYIIAENVAISGDQIVLGAPLVEYPSLIAGGAVVTLKKVDGQWKYGQTLSIPHGTKGAQFGTALALHGDTLVVGAVEKDYSESIPYAGAVYTFQLVQGQWKFQTEFNSDVPIRSGRFGGAVALGEGVMYVHAWDIKSPSQESSYGNLYVFRKLSDGSWIREQRIYDPTDNGQNDFRGPIAVTENFVLVRGEAPSEIVNGIAAVLVLEIHVSAAPQLLGDFNRDNVVDSADYSVWRDAMGQAGLVPYSGADGSGDGVVGPEDYAVWKLHFGESLPTGSGSGDAAIAEANLLVASESLAAASGTAPIMELVNVDSSSGVRNPVVDWWLGESELKSEPSGERSDPQGARKSPLRVKPLASDAALLEWCWRRGGAFGGSRESHLDTGATWRGEAELVDSNGADAAFHALGVENCRLGGDFRSAEGPGRVIPG